jgi:peptide/nickel transport system permease protein
VQANMMNEPVVEPTRRKKSRHPFWSNTKALVGLGLVALFVLVAIIAPVIDRYSPTAEIFLPGQGPSAAHWLGTTALGQDVWSQLVVGTRVSLMVSFLAGIIATFIAVLVGIASGYAGGVVDNILSILTNIFLVIPSLPLVIILSAYLHLGNWGIIFVIAITSWAWGARSLRSQALTLVQRDYVLHAKLAGQPWWQVIFGEILPNMASLVVSGLLFAMINALLTEAGLDFLGLGNINAVSWGTMLYWAQNSEALINGMWWWFVPPGVAIALFGAALSLLNFSLDEITNPRLRQRKVR